MKKITDKQIRLVRILFKKLGWNEDDRTDFLRVFCKLTDCKPATLETLSIAQGSKMIQDLTALWNELHNRPQMATPGQVKYILEHWKCIDHDAMACGDKHLHAFLERKFGVTSVYDLTKRQASGAIAAIRNMEKRSMALARERALDYEVARTMPPIAQVYVTLTGETGVFVGLPSNGRVLDFPLKLDDNGRFN